MRYGRKRPGTQQLAATAWLMGTRSSYPGPKTTRWPLSTSTAVTKIRFGSARKSLMGR